MKVLTYKDSIFENQIKQSEFFDEWHNFAIFFNMEIYSISHAYHKKSSLIKRCYKVADRPTYYSVGSLKSTQVYLGYLLSRYYDAIPDNDCLIAYRKGVHPLDWVRDNLENKCRYLIKADVKKYYDNITHQKIFDTMKFFGFPNRGAKLIGNLSTMRKTVDLPNSRKVTRQCLQQGSSCSPVIANLVGYYIFDRHIQEWAAKLREQHPKLIIRYARYSDNLVLGLDGEIPNGFNIIHEYKHLIYKLAVDNKFHLHKWSVVPKNHPKRNQSFLGVVFNEKMRVDKNRMSKIKGALFSYITKPTTLTLNEWFRETGGFPSGAIDTLKTREELFLRSIQGKISAIKSVNEEDYNMLKKLFIAGKLLNKGYGNMHAGAYVRPKYVQEEDKSKLKEDIFSVVNTYKNKKEAVSGYEKRVKEVLKNYQ